LASNQAGFVPGQLALHGQPDKRGQQRRAVGVVVGSEGLSGSDEAVTLVGDIRTGFIERVLVDLGVPGGRRVNGRWSPRRPPSSPLPAVHHKSSGHDRAG
jgi:hypothetical protein